MKKSLVFLLILAVAGGIFAQEGSFSWSGAVDVNAKMDFNTGGDPEIYVIDDALTGASVDLTYTLGGLELGVGFSAFYVDEDTVWDYSSIGLTAGYTGDNFGLHAEMDLISDSALTSFGPTSLWGYYTFLGGDLRLDAAYKGGGNGTWAVSDIVLGEHFDGTGRDGWDKLDGGAGIQFTFTGIDSLSFGVQLPFVNFDSSAGDLFEYLFTYMTFGVAYDNGSLGVSFMAALDNVNFSKFSVDFHLGFYYQINDAMKVNFDAAMLIGPENILGDSIIGVSLGLGFSYNADPLSLGLTVKAIDLANDGVADSFKGSALEIAANVGFAFSDFLSAHLGLTFDVGLGKEFEPTYQLLEIEIAPGLDFTVAPNATIGLGYCVRLGLGDGYSDTLKEHNITLAFHWAF